MPIWNMLSGAFPRTRIRICPNLIQKDNQPSQNLERTHNYMNDTDETLREGAPMGRRYDSVKSVMRAQGVPEAVQKKVAELARDHSVGLHLAKMRTRAGLTQAELAKQLEVTQGAISKLEASPDGAITLRDIEQYSIACRERVTITFGKRINHVEAVKLHSLSIKAHLEALAGIANQDETLEREISSFFGEAFFNILTILSHCNDKLPNSGSDFELKVETSRMVGRSFAFKPITEEAITV
jgi:transcriptional regulator with XRE-family HTH domain